MELIQKHSILQAQSSVRHLVIPALQAVIIDEAIRQRHDVRVHAVLEVQVNDSLGVRFGQAPEERHVKTAFARLCVFDLGTKKSNLIITIGCQVTERRRTSGGSWKWSPTSTKVSAKRSGPRHVGSVICDASSTMQ